MSMLFNTAQSLSPVSRSLSASIPMSISMLKATLSSISIHHHPHHPSH